MSEPTGTDETFVLVRAFPDVSTRWQVTDGHRHQWTSGGRRLVFSRYSSPEDSWWTLDVEPREDRLTFSQPRLLFQGRFASSWDVDETGERFVLIEPEGDQEAPQRFVLVDGWSAELRRRVPFAGSP